MEVDICPVTLCEISGTDCPYIETWLLQDTVKLSDMSSKLKKIKTCFLCFCGWCLEKAQFCTPFAGRKNDARVIWNEVKD
jgi:hypothetical protein